MRSFIGGLWRRLGHTGWCLGNVDAATCWRFTGAVLLAVAHRRATAPAQYDAGSRDHSERAATGC